ncbi:metalloendoproteinase 4-MMP [Prosopis cineraria]|uniref:metalloendoproteinase 4-MMP n=1 Tax=Prosopis cineraria TaxID=364024 RepID=UPI002410A68D|nr:metalloendoproteinase 4-MMP [Prosopis cineraria]
MSLSLLNPSLSLPFFFVVFFSSPLKCILSRTLQHDSFPSILTKVSVADERSFQRLVEASRGSKVTSISHIKRYFSRFGYLPLQNNTSFSDVFDKGFELALVRYQRNLGLLVTGKLDFATLNQIVMPRCGVQDTVHDHHYHGSHSTRHFMYFPGKPRWARSMPMTLTYAISPENMIQNLSLREIREAFKRAFSRWASVIPVSFVEAEDYGFADIKIGFYSGDHGDGEPFDGVLGVLAHSFSPESGRLHLDAAETWAVNFRSEKSPVAVDLESVATHEIGHLLGLSHSTVKEAVMYPSLKPRDKRAELNLDDIKGVQSLYGSNPNFRFESSLESDMSANEASDLGGKSLWFVGFVMFSLVHIFCLCYGFLGFFFLTF